MTEREGALIILSGGMDSGALLMVAKEFGYDVRFALSFDYSQRHRKELHYAAALAELLGVEHAEINMKLAGLTGLLEDSGSSLVDGSVDVPEGHYAEENMKKTVVPNRNMMMLSIAASVAVAQNLPVVLTAVHAGDHFVYPDCRPQFIEAVSKAAQVGNVGFGYKERGVRIDAPFLHKTKAEIATLGYLGGLQFESTWSCYKGGEYQCGKCGTCVERLEAIEDAAKELGFEEGGDIDMTRYDDNDFWKAVTKNG